MFPISQYHFFDYKYNIEGYSGQDFDSPARLVFTISAVILITALLILFRKPKKERVEIYLKIVGIALLAFEIFKITWESYWDVKTGRGLNVGGIAPLYTCSLFMYCEIIGAFSKGKVRDVCFKWCATIGLLAGLSNVVVPQGFKWYPTFSFGCLHSLGYHTTMVFTALFIVTSKTVRFEWKDMFKVMIPHLVFSIPVIILNIRFGWDYMQYIEAGGVPLLEDLSDRLAENGLRHLTIPIMVGVYFLFAAFFTTIYTLCGKIAKKEKVCYNK